MKKALFIIGILIISIFIAGCDIVSEDEEAAAAEIIAEEEGISEEEAANMAGEAVNNGAMQWLSCRDSDGGKNYYEKGTRTVTYIYKGRQKTHTIRDQCGLVIKKNLVEYYCNGKRPAKQVYSRCDACERGACKTGSQINLGSLPPGQDCVDTDENNDIFVRGSTTGYSCGDHSNDLKTVDDVCRKGGNDVHECDGDRCKVRQYDCSDGAGQCIEQIPAVKCEFGCKDGACLQSYTAAGQGATFTGSTCVDSDKGYYPFVKGEASVQLTTGATATVVDECVGSKLKEATCDNNQAVDTHQDNNYDCPNGCEDGACLEEVQDPACVDSDGENFFKKGKTTGHLGCIEMNNPVIDHRDRCVDASGNEVSSCDAGCEVEEYICGTQCNEVSSFKRICDIGCKNGACLKGCTVEWVCKSDKFKAYQKSDCSLTQTSFCPRGCEEGVCK